MSHGHPIDDLRAEVTRMLDTLDPGSPIAAIVLFQVDGAKEKTFVTNADVLAEATRRLPGANVFAYHERQPGGGSPGSIEYLIYEDWETVEQFRAQWDSEHLKKFQYGVGDLLTGAPDLRFYRGWSESGARAGVPQTGQLKCYGQFGEHVPCAGTGQDGELRAGAAWPDPRFTDNQNGTVTDNL